MSHYCLPRGPVPPSDAEHRQERYPRSDWLNIAGESSSITPYASSAVSGCSGTISPPARYRHRQLLQYRLTLTGEEISVRLLLEELDDISEVVLVYEGPRVVKKIAR